MSELSLYDIIIIGEGPAGYCAAIRLAQLGLSAVVVDKREAMGGTCLNVGCIPSKALLDSSERFAMAQNGFAQHGIKVENVSLDLGVTFATGSFPFRGNGRALAMGMTDGFVKVLSDAGTDAVLGVHIVGPGASELIAESVSVMEFGGSAEDIARRTIHAHPTLSEAVREAALDVDKRALHAPPVPRKI